MEDYRKQCISDEDYENPFEYDTKVESTPIRGFRDFNQHDSFRNFVGSQMSSSFKSPIFSIAPTANSQRSLPKLKLREFDGNPLDWPEWSGMFLATVDSSDISKDEKTSHLKNFLVGKAKRAVNGMGYASAMYDLAWNTLQRKFGQSHHIVSSQLAKIQNFSQIRFNDLAFFVEFTDTVSSFVNILQQFGYSNDLFSSSNLDIAISKFLWTPKEDGLCSLNHQLGQCAHQI